MSYVDMCMGMLYVYPTLLKIMITIQFLSDVVRYVLYRYVGMSYVGAPPYRGSRTACGYSCRCVIGTPPQHYSYCHVGMSYTVM